MAPPRDWIDDVDFTDTCQVDGFEKPNAVTGGTRVTEAINQLTGGIVSVKDCAVTRRTCRIVFEADVAHWSQKDDPQNVRP